MEKIKIAKELYKNTINNYYKIFIDEYIKKKELNSNEFSNLKTDVIIDYSKIYNLIKVY